ncbi:hypothetical protein KC19_VG097900 [Ceratodon purpureus]|uniref:XS domain-containing protein n=1 Tax=Ceratodon purpureus TaxID=3225 RepID=A0A8T0HNU1_CERPU|nr:hypothetical protein KC19_VG097900 [Ceratodon purpureus]
MIAIALDLKPKRLDMAFCLILSDRGMSYSPGLSESSWNVDPVAAGPSQPLNGWDDPVDGWELQPSYNSGYGEYNNNGKAPFDTASNGSSSFTKVKSRKGGMNRQEYSTPPHPGGRGGRGGRGAGRGGGTANRGGRGGRGGTFIGGRGGAKSQLQGAWGQSNNNFRQYEDYGGGARGWEANGGGCQAPSWSPENGWQQVGGNNGGLSESSSRSAPSKGSNNAWHQGSRASSTGSNLGQQAGDTGGGNVEVYDYPASPFSDSQCSDLDHVEDDSDDAFFSDDSYIQESHEDQKKIKWFRDFFQDLDSMNNDQLNEHDRQWHCPACKGGPGAIDWFRGLAPLATHARTMRSRRVKLHRKFAEVLEEELRTRRSGAPCVESVQGVFGKWKGVNDERDSRQQLVIWPPILVIQNTQLDQDDEGKWIGMGNKELLDMFKDYNPLKPRHAYGPLGHRGMSLLIFSDSPAGYHDAVRLSNHFINLRRGRDDWHRPSKLIFRPGGNRILYGYLAVKEDLDIFNRHSKGKTLVKYEVRKLQEVVVEPMQRMEQENQQMQSLQNEHNTLKKTVSETSRILELRGEELQILRDRAEKQHAENKRQLADMEEFYQQESAQWADDLATKNSEMQKFRDDFDKIYSSRCQELEAQRSSLPNNQEQQTLMTDSILQKTKEVEGSLLEAQDFENKLKELEQQHHERRVQFQKQQHETALAFEQQIKTERTKFLHSFEKQML